MKDKSYNRKDRVFCKWRKWYDATICYCTGSVSIHIIIMADKLM